MDCREAAEFLRTHDNYLILIHKRPDGDTTGCAAGLCRALRALGKTAHVLPSPDATTLYAGYLDGLTAPEGFAPDTVVSVDVAALGLLPPNAEPYKNRVDLAIDHGAHILDMLRDPRVVKPANPANAHIVLDEED